jgi:hypothetical protein
MDIETIARRQMRDALSLLCGDFNGEYPISILDF